MFAIKTSDTVYTGFHSRRDVFVCAYSTVVEEYTQMDEYHIPIPEYHRRINQAVNSA